MVGGNIDTNNNDNTGRCSLSPLSSWPGLHFLLGLHHDSCGQIIVILCRSEREALSAQCWWGREIRIHVKSLGCAPVCCTHAAAAGDKRGGGGGGDGDGGDGDGDGGDGDGDGGDGDGGFDAADGGVAVMV